MVLNEVLKVTVTFIVKEAMVDDFLYFRFQFIMISMRTGSIECREIKRFNAVYRACECAFICSKSPLKFFRIYI